MHCKAKKPEQIWRCCHRDSLMAVLVRRSIGWEAFKEKLFQKYEAIQWESMRIKMINLHSRIVCYSIEKRPDNREFNSEVSILNFSSSVCDKILDMWVCFEIWIRNFESIPNLENWLPHSRKRVAIQICFRDLYKIFHCQ